MYCIYHPRYALLSPMHHYEPVILGFGLGLVFWTCPNFQTFSHLGLNSQHEQRRRENGQRYCLATMAKDTDCSGRRDEMTFLWKQERHNLNDLLGWEHFSHALPSKVKNKHKKLDNMQRNLKITKRNYVTVNERTLCMLQACFYLTIKFHLKYRLKHKPLIWKSCDTTIKHLTEAVKTEKHCILGKGLALSCQLPALLLCL